ncbi:MAG TPA: group III truncated hemoglobin [Phenylobacterium sp.]|jgi:hemoglobin|uniref:Group III truncated hemoglobin n=1 Tax=Phenylobacterium conjunctum TaxID=1298959 RepID=A0ABW3T1Y7_9CAUL|nr:group III truncated hemoglobin [Phenylobacterium sp.]HQN52666.1 group III truncated hemoglobin [Phenylobacterium sp.]HQP20145.1 group III truncated hemoglobin [Phenylobacterium sp.]
MTTPVSDRRQRLAPGASVGVTEAMCRQVVDAFYARVRADPELGPIFNGAIGDHWDAHLAKLADFWSSVLLMTGRFKGTPMTVHVALPRAEPEHFQIWLGLFRQTVTEICPPPAAALFVEKAEMIARSLQFGIAASRGELPGGRRAG